MSTSNIAISAAVATNATAMKFKAGMLIVLQLTALVSLICLLHFLVPSVGGVALFAKVAVMGFAGMFSAVICYQVAAKLKRIL